MKTSDAVALVALLKRKGLTVSTAESCTGGLVASSIVDVPGASAVFPGGAVTYAASVKTALLGVPEDLIETRGVGSHDVAAAKHRARRLNAAGSDLLLQLHKAGEQFFFFL